MSKKHKHRLVRARERNGRIQREPTLTPVANVKRIRDGLVKMAGHAEYGSELGRLFLEHKITARMFAAGQKWATTVAAASHAMQSPAANPKSLAIGESGTSHPVDPDSEEGRKEVRKHKHAVIAYQVACNVLPQDERRAVETVCERGQSLDGYQQLIDL